MDAAWTRRGGWVRSRAKRSFLGVVAGRVAKDALTGAQVRLGVPVAGQGAQHVGLSLEASVAYIEEVYGDYLRYAGLGEASLAGASVLELGPGDSLGVALRFIGAGARQVTTVDRFVTRCDPAQQAAILEALAFQLEAGARGRASAALAPGSPHGVDASMIRVIQGLPVEVASARLEPSGFDLIVSRAVLEHVWGLGAAFETMDACLAPGGLMLHKVDLRDHGLFSDGGQNPLRFLTVPEPLYTLMGRCSGIPNRARVDWYRRELERRGYEARFLVTHVIGREDEIVPHAETIGEADMDRARALIAAIAPRLRPRFRPVEAETLATAGVFVVARKADCPTAAGQRSSVRVGLSRGSSEV